MSLQLLNDFILDIKVNSIQSTVPIGGSIPDNSILNSKLVDKTIENTKIKDGTIISSLLDTDIAITNLAARSLYVVNGVGLYLTNGTDTLGGGSTQILTTAIAANSIVLLTRTSDPTVDAGILAVRSIVPFTSFDVFSSLGADNGTFSWLIINPA